MRAPPCRSTRSRLLSGCSRPNTEAEEDVVRAASENQAQEERCVRRPKITWRYNNHCAARECVRRKGPGSRQAERGGREQTNKRKGRESGESREGGDLNAGNVLPQPPAVQATRCKARSRASVRDKRRRAQGGRHTHVLRRLAPLRLPGARQAPAALIRAVHRDVRLLVKGHVVLIGRSNIAAPVRRAAGKVTQRPTAPEGRRRRWRCGATNAANARPQAAGDLHEGGGGEGGEPALSQKGYLSPMNTSWRIFVNFKPSPKYHFMKMT